jgi:uncharacterized membrane protein YdjX (TVP38/TMEM64 family)
VASPVDFSLHFARRNRRLLNTGVLIVFVLAAGYWLLGQHLTLENLKANQAYLLQASERDPLMTMAVFVACYVMLALVGVPGRGLLTLAGGFLFGGVIGPVVVILSVTTGATMAFLAARWVLREWVRARYADRLRPLERGLERNGFNYLLTLRLLPILPMLVVNLGSGISGIKLRTFIIATVLGTMPGSIIASQAGSHLRDIHSFGDIFSPAGLAMLGLLGVLALSPVLFRWVRARRSHIVIEDQRGSRAFNPRV